MKAVASNSVAIALDLERVLGIGLLPLEIDGHVRIGAHDDGLLRLHDLFDHIVLNAPAAVATEVFDVEKYSCFEHPSFYLSCV